MQLNRAIFVFTLSGFAMFQPFDDTGAQPKPAALLAEISSESGAALGVDEMLAACAKVLENRANHDQKEIADALRHRGLAYIRQRRMNEASLAFAEILKLPLATPDDRAMHAYALLAIGKKAEAAEICKNVLKLAPKNLKALNVLAMVDYTENRSNDAIEKCKRALEIDPTDSECRLTIAFVYFKQGDPVSCLEQTDRLLARHPYHPLDPGYVYRMRGTCLIWLNKPNESLNNFLVAHHLDRESTDAVLGIYTSFRLLSKHNTALIWAEKMLSSHPRQPIGYVWKAESLASIGDTEGAKKRARRAYEVTVPTPEVMSSVGAVYCRIGEYKAALDCFNDALKAEPNEMTALCGKASILSWCPNDNLRNGAEAMRIAKSALNDSTLTAAGKWEPLLAMAEAYAESRNYDEAKKLALKVVETVKDCPHYRTEAEARLRCFENGRPFRFECKSEKN